MIHVFVQKTFCTNKRKRYIDRQIYRQMQLAPHSPLLGAMFSDLSLAFTKYLQTSRVDNQVSDTPLGGLPIGSLARLLTHRWSPRFAKPSINESEPG